MKQNMLQCRQEGSKEGAAGVVSCGNKQGNGRNGMRTTVGRNQRGKGGVA